MNVTIALEDEQVVADRARWTAEAEYEISFEQSAIGVVIAGLDGRVTRVNLAACELLGRSQEELIGSRFGDYGHPDEIRIGQAVTARARDRAGHVSGRTALPSAGRVDGLGGDPCDARAQRSR